MKSDEDVRGDLEITLLRGRNAVIVLASPRFGQLFLSAEDAEWLRERLAHSLLEAGETPAPPRAKWAWVNDDFTRDRPSHLCDRDAGIVGRGRYIGEGEWLVYVCDRCGAVGA